jgi:hypothetical protein
MALNDGSSNLVIINDIKFNPNVDEVRVYVKQVSGSGTAGGTFNNGGTWRTRPLNVINESATDNNEGSDYVTLGSNQITAIWDNISFRGFASAFYVNVHQARLYNVTGTTLVVTGTNQKAIANTQPSSNSSIVAGNVHYPGVPTVMELQHVCQTSRSGDGWGQAGNFGNEVYAYIELVLR